MTLAAIVVAGEKSARRPGGSGQDGKGAADLDHLTIGREALRALLQRLNELPLAKRERVAGLAPERADIIVAGGAVLLVALEVLRATELTVSQRNLRYGALTESQGTEDA